MASEVPNVLNALFNAQTFKAQTLATPSGGIKKALCQTRTNAVTTVKNYS